MGVLGFGWDVVVVVAVVTVVVAVVGVGIAGYPVPKEGVGGRSGQQCRPRRQGVAERW